MTPITLALLIFSIMLLLMVIRVPIAGAMFLAGTAGFILQTGVAPYLNFLNNLAFARLANYDLSVIPLFILMGHFATQGGISKALFQFAAAVMGRFKGGLAMGAVLACGAFGAICGSSVATAATITGVALPEMKRHGYSGRLSTGTLAAGGTLGILIPPSVPLVIYAILTEQNIAKLFMAAFIPGLIAMVGYMVVISIVAHRNPGEAPAGDRFSWVQRLKAVSETWPVMLIFAVVIGGIYGGFFTPTEAASIGTVATAAVALTSGGLRGKGFLECVYGAAASTGMIFMILIGADVLNVFLVLTRLNTELAAWVIGLEMAPVVVLFIIIGIYLVLGCVMDSLSMILLTIPIFFPIVMGIDLFGLGLEDKAIWFGIIVLMVVEIGLITPPVGMNVFIISSMTKGVPMKEIFRYVMAFLVSDLLRIVALVFFPGVALVALKF